MASEPNDTESQSTSIRDKLRLLLPSRYYRWDRLGLWVALAVGVLIPTMICWLIPNLAHIQRESLENQNATATALAWDAWNEQYTGLVTLCDDLPSADELVPPPDNLRLLVVQNGSSQNRFQGGLPADWQPTYPGEVSVIACLGTERTHFTDTCLNGYKPDLSVYGQRYVLRGDTDMYLDYELQRYATPVTLIDIKSGKAIVQTQVWGSDSVICEGIETMDFSGRRLTADMFTEWLSATLQDS